MHLGPVDTVSDYRRDGREFCTAEELLAGRRPWQGVWVSAPEVEFGYLLVQKVLQGVSTAQQQPHLQTLLQELGARAGTITQRLFGAKLGECVTQWIATEHWTTLESHLPQLQRALLWQVLWHDPRSFLRYWLPEGIRTWRRNDGPVTTPYTKPPHPLSSTTTAADTSPRGDAP
jgi:hypothetical protein